MAYIGKSPSGTGVRIRYYFTQTSGGATSISGTDDNNKTLSFSDGEYVDVYLNGVSLVAGTDYNTTTANTIGGLSALANGDVIEVVVYDIFTVADTVSQSSGGTFSGAVTFSSNLTADGGTIKLDGNYPTGTGNVALGDGALDDGSLSGNFNTAIGDNALSANTSGASNTAIGNDAGISNTTGFQNVFVGDIAGDANTTGAAGVAVGYSALGANTTAPNNTAVGYLALTANTTGDTNVAVGKDSMKANTTGTNNTALGPRTLQANTTAYNNVAVGDLALGANTTGNNLVAVGVSALGANTTGTSNVAVGYRAGDSITTGTKNTVMGNDVANNLTEGSYNAFYGSDAGAAVTTGSKNSIIGGYNGNQDGLDIRTASNQTVISDGDGNIKLYVDDSDKIYNQVGYSYGYGGYRGDINVAASGITIGFGGGNGNFRNIYASDSGGSIVLYFHSGSNAATLSTGGAWTDASDASYKRDITDLSYGIDTVKSLQPRTYHLVANENDDDPQIGFVAQELEAHVPEVVVSGEDKDGSTKKGVSYGRMTAVLTKALQEAIAKIETLETQRADLEARVTALENV